MQVLEAEHSKVIVKSFYLIYICKNKSNPHLISRARENLKRFDVSFWSAGLPYLSSKSSGKNIINVKNYLGSALLGFNDSILFLLKSYSGKSVETSVSVQTVALFSLYFTVFGWHEWSYYYYEIVVWDKEESKAVGRAWARREKVGASPSCGLRLLREEGGWG